MAVHPIVGIEDPMSNTSTPHKQRAAFGRIMLCIDSTEDWADAAALISSLADADTRVCIVGLLENARAMIPHAPLAFFNLSAAHAHLQRGVEVSVSTAQACLKRAGLDVETHITDLFERGGDAAHALTRAAQAWRADLMVLGARQHLCILQWTERAARDAPSMAHCSILVLPEHPSHKLTTRPDRLLCAVDGSPASLESLRAGFKLADPGAHVKAIYVVDRSARGADASRATLEDAFLEEGRAALAKAREVFSQTWGAQGFTFDAELVHTGEAGDDVAHAIVREAACAKADAILMGTHGHRGVARWMLGTVSGRVAELTESPLLLSRRRPPEAIATA
ncbi:universal stress protein [Caballeronia sp. NK8]|uniref:universal stress protein n=1 Tax=Caballeronia sp. NK8 TaxID=140098 RepID=UPI001BD0F5A3|nr:universal stress protein [Caballeronia sp. NK8]